MTKKRWTEKQIKKKISEIESQINYRKNTIRRTEEELRDLTILLDFYKQKLSKKYNNPSSKRFGGPEGNEDLTEGT